MRQIGNHGWLWGNFDICLDVQLLHDADRLGGYLMDCIPCVNLVAV